MGLLRGLLIGLTMAVVLSVLVGVAMPVSGSLLMVSGQLFVSTVLLLGIVWLLPHFRRRR